LPFGIINIKAVIFYLFNIGQKAGRGWRVPGLHPMICLVLGLRAAGKGHKIISNNQALVKLNSPFNGEFGLIA
jgi:hypothetical protein